jgi:hypothetical protein
MRRHRDPEIIPSALISGPDVESYRRAGRQAGEEDKQAKIVAEGVEVHVEQVRRIQQRCSSEHEFAAGHVADGYNEPIAEAQAAHEEAGHRLDMAKATAEESRLKLLGAIRKRDATAERVTQLVDPELADQPPDGDVPPGPDGESPPPPPRAFRYVLERKLPKDVGYATLTAGAGAEGFLNIQAFAATGETSSGSFVLAVLVGLCVIGLAHLIGNGTADLLENRPGARGRSLATLAQVVLAAPFLVAGIFGTSIIRASFYAEQGQANPATAVHIPAAALVALAFMLAAMAIATSIAMRNMLADDLARQDRAIADYQDAHERAWSEIRDAQDAVSTTAAALNELFRKLDSDYRARAAHVRKCFEAFLDQYSAAAGIRVTGSLPDLAPPQLVADARAWMACHPFGSLAPPTLPFSAALKAVPGQPYFGNFRAPETPNGLTAPDPASGNGVRQPGTSPLSRAD